MYNQIKKQHVFIIGCKGIPAQYGGFETFVDKLTRYSQNSSIQYHVACAVESKYLKEGADEFRYNNADCFKIGLRNFGSAKAVVYDIEALKWSIAYVERYNIEHPIFYILACRIGPFIGHFKKKIKKFKGEIYVNPDGHEFLRAKWIRPIRKYWKISEKFMVKNADLLICDSKNIEKYIHDFYAQYNPKTTYISYGAETTKSTLADNAYEWIQWCGNYKIRLKEYYLMVSRLVVEIIRYD